MTKKKLTVWFLPISSIPFLLIGIHMARSSMMEADGANLFGLLTGLTLFLGGLGLLFVGVKALIEKGPEAKDALDEEPTLR